MRIRTIKPEFFLHAELYDAEAAEGLPLRLAFIGLWCAADREGRFKWEPRRLKAQILPYDDGVDFSRVLHALATRGFIRHYASNGAEFGVIPSFSRHQVINNRESGSVLPKYDDESQLLTRAPRVPDACPTRLNLDQGEGKGREQGTGKGKEGERAVPASVAITEVLSLEAQVINPAQTASKPDKSPAQLRAEKLHGKRESTPWDHSELSAWKCARAVVEATSEEEWQLLEWFYSLPQSETFARKALAQTLNNWAGELTKAKAHKVSATAAPGRKPATPLFR